MKRNKYWRVILPEPKLPKIHKMGLRLLAIAFFSMAFVMPVCLRFEKTSEWSSILLWCGMTSGLLLFIPALWFYSIGSDPEKFYTQEWQKWFVRPAYGGLVLLTISVSIGVAMEGMGIIVGYIPLFVLLIICLAFIRHHWLYFQKEILLTKREGN